MKSFLPGDFIATEEEFSPGENTFDENGNILSDSQGKLSEDSVRKSVSIKKNKNLLMLKPGSIVYGIVTLVRTSSVAIEILPCDDSKKRQVTGMTFASLPVRNVSRNYVENLKDEFKIGDIIKAKIAVVLPFAIDLATNEQNLGVVKGFCSKCRHPLSLLGHGQLKCTNCGSPEHRKVSSDYGREENCV